MQNYFYQLVVMKWPQYYFAEYVDFRAATVSQLMKAKEQTETPTSHLELK